MRELRGGAQRELKAALAAKVALVPGSNFLSGQNNLSNAANEEFNKMNNDPLVAMREAEQEAPHPCK